MPIPSSDDLLLPLLKFLAHGTHTLQGAARDFAPSLPLSPLERREHELNTPRSPLTQALGRSWRLLDWAQLIERGADPLRRHLSPRGAAVLAQKPARLSVAFLEQFPEFIEARERHARELMARSFRDLRLEYYSAGRNVFAEGSLAAAPVLLGYAIEMALKAGLHKAQSDWLPGDTTLVKTSHDLKKLYLRAREFGVFANTHISTDFLKYASDHFTRRYPSGGTDLLEGLRRGWSIGTHKLGSYDDCICQLDGSLPSFRGSAEESIIFAALHDPFRRQHADAIFTDNPFAFQLAHLYLPPIGASVPPGSHLAWLREDPAREARFRTAAADDSDIRLRLHLAALYRYPGPGEPDPDPLAVGLRHDRSAADPFLRHIDWILRRLEGEFGSHAVFLREVDGHRDNLDIWVFDRTARGGHYWSRLPLGHRTLLGLHARQPHVEDELDEWVSATRRRFARKRRNLRMPPCYWWAPTSDPTTPGTAGVRAP
jgi:hypothetical protein